MYDIIIIGAGTAGCVLANRLSADPARRVLVLEAGHGAPLNSDIPSNWLLMANSEVDWAYYTEPQAGCRGRRIFWPRGKMLGGSGSMNAMLYVRGLPSDYDRWEALGCPGWGWSDVLPAFIKSENNERLGNSPYHGVGGGLNISDSRYVDPTERLWMQAAQAAGFPRNEDFNGERQDGVGYLQLTVKDGERWGTGKGFLVPALSRPNLTVKKGIRVLRLLLSGQRVTGVEYLEKGRVQTASADSEVVLSAGAIGSTQILLLSGIGPADELTALDVEPLHDLPGVGKNLKDHPNLPLSFATKERVGISGMTAAELDAAFAEWQDKRTGPLTSSWGIAAGFARSRPEVAEPDLQLYCVVAQHRDQARFLWPEYGFTLHSTLQRPLSHGEIRLRSNDPLEAPAIDPRYFSSDPSGLDLATLVEGVKINRAIAAQSPLKEIVARETLLSAGARTDAEIADYVRAHVVTIFHAAGTCRMGSDPLAVVDPTLRVRGLDGLRVADASVFPDMISGNINAATVMIGERASDFILSSQAAAIAA